MANHEVPLTWGIMRVGRSLSTLDASIQTLWPDANFSKLARAYFKDRTRRAMSARGRIERFRQVMTELSVVGADAQLLLGNGIRQQALRLHGVLDRVTHVRYTVLTWLIRFSWLAMGVIAWFAFLDEGRNTILHSLLFHDVGVDMMVNAAPDLHPVHWVILIGLFISPSPASRGRRAGRSATVTAPSAPSSLRGARHSVALMPSETAKEHRREERHWSAALPAKIVLQTNGWRGSSPRRRSRCGRHRRRIARR